MATTTLGRRLRKKALKEASRSRKSTLDQSTGDYVAVESEHEHHPFAHGQRIGVNSWELHYNWEKDRAYFLNATTKKIVWGFPLREILQIKGMVGPPGDDDWECHVDTTSAKRYFTSPKRKRVQWTVPLNYRGPLKRIPFFNEDWEPKATPVESVMESEHEEEVAEEDDGSFAMAAPAAIRTNMELDQLLKSITIKQVLDDDAVCAGFHRFVVANLAEENLLFWGACEVFTKGEWKGMKVLGVTKYGAPTDGAKSPAGAESRKPSIGRKLSSIPAMRISSLSRRASKVLSIRSNQDTKKKEEEEDCEEEEEDCEGQDQLQAQMAGSRVSYRIGRTVNQPITALEEAKLLNAKFLQPGAPMWVFVSDKAQKDIKNAIKEGDTNEQVMNRSLFLKIQTEVLSTMQNGHLHRFILAVMADKKAGLSDSTSKQLRFVPDQVLRLALRQLGGLSLDGEAL